VIKFVKMKDLLEAVGAYINAKLMVEWECFELGSTAFKD